MIAYIVRAMLRLAIFVPINRAYIIWVEAGGWVDVYGGRLLLKDYMAIYRLLDHGDERNTPFAVYCLSPHC